MKGIVVNLRQAKDQTALCILLGSSISIDHVVVHGQ